MIDFRLFWYIIVPLNLYLRSDISVYPTALRSTAVGACSGVARLGAMITPYVAQVLLKNSVAIATGVYSLAALLAGVACLLLPIETKGREMRDTVTVNT